ncbi:MAG: hypothetical protein IPJ30_17475 [Acidobacteria bacterium]|nr:hypothetical protein [Acidobacteriota bacterium]
MSWLFSLLLASGILTSDATLPVRQDQFQNDNKPAVAAADETERSEQTYPLSANGRVSVSNVNGSITIDTWENNQVKLEIVKTADSKEWLEDVEVKIDAKSDSLTIETEYRNRDRGSWNRMGKVVVDYRLTVPKNAVLDEIETVNGSISITNAQNVTKAKAVNGQVRAQNLRGVADLSTVNGGVVADFEQLAGNGNITLGTINGSVSLTIPSDVNATVKADSMNGPITNDFGLPVRKGRYVGRDLFGKIGNGEASIKLNSINGPLTIKRKSDGRNPNPVVDLLPTRSSEDESDTLDVPDAEELSKIDSEVRKANKEAVKAMEEARKEFEKARPEIEKATQDAMRQSAEIFERSKELIKTEEFKRIRVEAERMRREMRERFRNARFIGGPPVIDKKSESFDVKGVPTVTVKADDAEISVRGWDRPVVEYTVTRISENRAPKPLEVKAVSSGSDVNISVENEAVCEDCPGGGASVRIEVMVPRKSNLRLTSDGEIRLENVSGDIRVEGGDEAVNVRDVDGKLAVKNTDGRVRVIGFRGDAVAETVDGEISLEGEFDSFRAEAVDGTVILTLPGSPNATITSNTRSVEANGLPFVFVGNESENYTYKLGDGGNNFTFSAEDGRLVIRTSMSINSAN